MMGADYGAATLRTSQTGTGVTCVALKIFWISSRHTWKGLHPHRAAGHGSRAGSDGLDGGAESRRHRKG
jgi:hypothetical protein